MDKLGDEPSGIGGEAFSLAFIMTLRTRCRITVLAAVNSMAMLFAMASEAQVTDAVSIVHMQGKAPIAPDAISVLGPDLFGDSINLFNGAFSFEQTDISLPGNSALPVALVRTHSPGRPWSVRGSAADWDLNTPRIEGVFPGGAGWIPFNGTAAQRCSGPYALLPPTFTTPSFFDPTREVFLAGTDILPWEYGAGINISVPGNGSQELLRRSSGNVLAPTDGNI